jgi:murein DD-endopeptidase MepM/ murein hydrolase activator NlpD
MSSSWNLDAQDDQSRRDTAAPVVDAMVVPEGLEFLGLGSTVARSTAARSTAAPAAVDGALPTRREARAAALVKPSRTQSPRAKSPRTKSPRTKSTRSPKRARTMSTTSRSENPVRTERAPRPTDRPSKTLARTAKSDARSARSVSTTPKPRKRSFRRQLLPKIVSIGAMLGVGAFLVATSVPANALMNGSAAAATSTSRVESQSLAAVNKNAVAQTSARDGYTVATLFDMTRAATVPDKWTYTNDSNGTIQWPFPVQVPIAQGFGPKTSSCFYCNAFHQGVDFDGGNGSPIGAISAGVVSNVTLGHSGLGNNVTIDHVINGQNIQSVYAHMMDGSVKVTVGQTVTVAQEVGQVGATGETTGPHLHLEIHLNGVPIDPFAWLKANAN